MVIIYSLSKCVDRLTNLKNNCVSKLFVMPIAAGVMVLPSVQVGRTLTVGRRTRETSAKGREKELEDQAKG